MGSHGDAVERAVVLALAVVRALLYGAFDAMVGMTGIHTFVPPYPLNQRAGLPSACFSIRRPAGVIPGKPWRNTKSLTNANENVMMVTHFGGYRPFWAQ